MTSAVARIATTVSVALSGERGYEIQIGSGLLSTAGERLQRVARSGHVVILTQPKIAALWGGALRDSLCAGGFDAPDLVTFPAGERFKTVATMARLYDKLYNLPRTVERRTLIVALGGGVVGDVAGFVAASYLRGLDYVQVPTTLLAMVDSSVGGKTGVDFRDGKNLIGAFHQPRAVIADLETLKTLPSREFRSGLGEVVKYGVIRDPSLLAPNRLEVSQSEALAEMVRCSCEIKAEVVSADEREESGLRAILNYGHTVGHALESATRYRRYKHGEAVAIGMAAAACIGEAAGVTPVPVREAVIAACRVQALPVKRPSDVPVEDLIALMARDKKAEGGVVRFVLARSLGKAELMGGITETMLRAGLALQDEVCGREDGNIGEAVR
ncbi:MAG: 3-dehydroquinate synthase [Cytophagales bacterium]|nr:3-dehydroquinate synthase [Armatimonadota bacterium]